MGVCSDEGEFLGIVVVVDVLTLVFAVSVQHVFEWHGERGSTSRLMLMSNNMQRVICDMWYVQGNIDIRGGF